MNRVVSTLALSFLNGSSSFLLTTRKPIRSQAGSKCGQIGPWPMDLAVLECLKNPHSLIMGELL